ncbi:MAG: flagellar basal body P-ring formation protein FlgA [Halochromatium sp.]|nr:flagellar basal body P-ring formation protein FlgA [Halochromatium sp.]
MHDSSPPRMLKHLFQGQWLAPSLAALQALSIRWSLALVLITTLLAAPPLQAEEAVAAAVQDFLQQQMTGDDDLVIKVHLPAASLPDCPSPQPFLPHRSRLGQGRISVGVRCGEQGQQVRYLQVDIERYGQYPVLRQEIAPGTQVTAAMLRQRQGNLSDLPRGAVLEAERIIGQVARRAVAAEVPLQLRQFESKPLVERGQLVSVEARGTNFRVSREGKALNAGGLGDLVRVQFGNRDLIQARVIGKAKLVVDF